MNEPEWVGVCAIDDLLPERGTAALVRGQQVALFRLADGSVHAVGHHDPFSGANVMARGIVGTRGDLDTVTSPMHKQVYDLRSGRCLDDPGLALPTWAVRLHGEQVLVSARAYDTSATSEPSPGASGESGS